MTRYVCGACSTLVTSEEHHCEQRQELQALLLRQMAAEPARTIEEALQLACIRRGQ